MSEGRPLGATASLLMNRDALAPAPLVSHPRPGPADATIAT
jgi:hypothetical protein